MSQSNSAAIRRRAPQSTTVPTPTQVSSPAPVPAPAGLTLPQTIAFIDKRLIALEIFMKETKSTPTENRFTPMTTIVESDATNLNAISEVLEEYNSRFEMLASEIQNMKDIVLNLQSYTMTVNKTLIDERINILSEVGTIASEPISEVQQDENNAMSNPDE